MRTIFKIATIFLVVMMFVAGHHLAMNYISQVENMEFDDVLINSSNHDNINQEYPKMNNRDHILKDDYIKYSKSPYG